MSTTVGISGTGRIGRLVIRKAFSERTNEVAVGMINSTSSIETIAHLLKYDTVHGKWEADVEVDKDHLVINGHRVLFTSERNPEQIPWRQHGVRTVIDATGAFNDRFGASKHLHAGAERVVITAPGKDMDFTVVMGVNEDQYDPEHHYLLSTASCTTNCLAPILHVLDRSFGISSGWMTTIHALTNDQNHMDNPHKDLRRARACSESMIPTSTGVGKALAGVLPHLAAKIQGIAVRVPTQNVSLVDLTARMNRSVSEEEVRAALMNASKGSLAPYIGVSNEPLVSSDYIGNEKSAMIDGLSMMTSGHQLKLLAWYDNEWAYACRVIDFVQYIADFSKKGGEESWNRPISN